MTDETLHAHTHFSRELVAFAWHVVSKTPREVSLNVSQGMESEKRT